MNSAASVSPKAPPQGFSKRTTSPPWRLAISVMRSQKKPLAKMPTFVPGSTKLLMAVSMPPLPVAEMTNVHSLVGAEDVAQHALVVLADLEEVGIEVPDDRLRHRLVHPGMHLGGAGAEQ